MYSRSACEQRWARALAPRTGAVGEELILELTEYFGLSRQEVRSRLSHATSRFANEWRAKVGNPNNQSEVIRFYNESETEIFDLVQWHANDPIHYRSLICLDIATRRSGRTVLDYGSGIGTDALLFSAAGFSVTLADVSDPLLAFARWRCERRGFKVTVVDLKREVLPRVRVDAVVCFDVLEHVLRPVRALGAIRRAMNGSGLLFLHAPFGPDPDRPMHVIHRDTISSRMRSIGFRSRHDLEREFPSWLWAPNVYESVEGPALDRLGYYVYDVWLPKPIGARLAAWYRFVRPRRTAPTRDSLGIRA